MQNPSVVRIFRRQVGRELYYWAFYEGRRHEFSEDLALRMVRTGKARIITKED